MNIDILKNTLQSLCLEFSKLCNDRKLKLVTAESCTAGLISGYLTDLPGSSAYIEGGFVTYSNHMKAKVLGVSEYSLNEFGAVSEQVAREMVQGALNNALMANIGVAVTGIAGPEGGSHHKPVGCVWIAVQRNNKPAIAKKFMFSGNREAVRLQTVIEAVKLLQYIAQD
ncbi:CinA family protein [Commensalibacter oyaizuii]|uniref:CinA family protein n=1 Tax=Commensalibacter oyaizuii TaxID=3043873 RepID=A0ABT6PZK2_9PROT|nr:CinA family protein [Commensalibacter sp. TBRC 16381]MDI2090249.1 CinA family protein [Commensalibacter sp. TBRC 16381]